MLLIPSLQQQEPWRFDLRSAIIGAIAAWLIAYFLYKNRAGIKRLGETLWSPIAKLRRRTRTSQEEKYIHALQGVLKNLLLFTPEDPEAIFQAPGFAAPAPLPTSLAEANELPAPLPVAFTDLLAGHSRIIIKGPRGSGRTTALAMAVWLSEQQAEEDAPYARFPIWVDLARVKELTEDEKSTPLSRFEQLATLFMPDLISKWLHKHLENEPSLILVDNWDLLPPDERGLVALWLHDIAQTFPESHWIIATGEQGYGALVEVGFVPLDLIPATGEAPILSLYTGWATLREREEVEPPEEAIQALRWAQQAGGSWMELTLRVITYLETEMIPTRPVDVLDMYLDHHVPEIDLGEGQEEVVAQARMFTLNTLSYIAKSHRLEMHAPTRQEVLDYIGTLLPPEEERPPKLEGTVRKLLGDSGLIERGGKAWTLQHYVWEEFLTAWELAGDEMGQDMAKAHLHDASWALLLEFYVGLGDSNELVRSLLRETGTTHDREILLRLARWSVVGPEDIPWRNVLMKALAQSFMASEITPEMRLKLGKALALTAGEGARAFFIKTLRHPALDIRAAALRGIGWTGTPREMPILAGALTDEHLEIGESAVAALAEMGTPGAVRMLSDALYEADERVILAISQALASLQKGQEVLREAAGSSDLLVRRSAAHALGLVDQPWAEEMLEEMAREDSEWLVRSAAESALNEKKEQAGHKNLVAAPPQIDQIDWLITWAARQGMGLGVGDAALEVLDRAVAEGPPEVKILGALTLMHIGREEHLRTLEPLLKDEEPAVRQVAALASRNIEQRYYVYMGE